MKKNLTRFFLLLFAVITTMSATATPSQRRFPLLSHNQRGLSTPVRATPVVGKKGTLPLPQLRTSSSKGLFTSSFKITDLNAHKPNKVTARAEGTTEIPQLIGSVIWSDNFSANGLYTIPTNSSQDFKNLFKYANAQYGGVLVDDTYFTCEYFEYPGLGSTIVYTGYDIHSGKDYFEVNGAYYTYSMTYDPTTSTVYAIANIEGLFALTKITFDIQQKRVLFDPIAGIELDKFGLWNSIACDSKGQLWAVYSDCVEPQVGAQLVCTGSTLYKIDKNTAVLTKIGETGYDSLYASDAIFDLKTDRLFWTVANSTDEGFLTELDTTTGAATIIYAFPGNEEVTGLAFPTPEAEADAPAAVTDIFANFTDGSLNGSIDFKAPVTLFNGAEGSGEISYIVTANGEPAASGITAYGANVKAPITVPTAGFYTFTVTVSNDKGESPKTEVKTYVGADTPEATSVTADYSEGVMTVTWLPVTSSINGGYIDVDNVTYTVTRYPDKEVVARNISETTFSENLIEPDKLVTYYYEVVATAGELSSEPAKSNPVSIGSVTPPFTATFDDSLDGFKVINANNDGYTWISIDGRARILYNASMDMDDWLISPAVKLKSGILYDIAAQFACGNPSYPERIEVKVGTSAQPDAMTTTLLEPTEIAQNTDAPMEWSNIFIPETDGLYYFGIHGISEKDRLALYVDNFTISEPKAANTPSAVSNLSVIPGADGALTATISFTTPSTTISGNDLADITKIELLRGKKVINTWTSPAVNTPLTYTDNLSFSGDYTYTVIVYNAQGNGPEAVASTYVGVDFPAIVTGIKAFETDKPGEVTITWNEVTTTEGDAPIDPSLVQYQVYRIVNGSPVPVSAFLDVTSYTYQAVAAGKQEFVQLAVVAKTERGYGKLVNASLSTNFPAGTPYHGLTLSNEDDINDYILGVNSIGGGSWSVYDDTFIPSQDNDNRLFAMYGPYENNYGDLYTGLITLEGISNPGLTFYTFNIGGISGGLSDINEISVSVKEKGAQEFATVKTIIVSETGPENSWNRVVVDLSAYTGKTIQVNFYSIVKAATYTIIDNIRIGSLYANDLAVTSITAPSEVTTGNNYTIGVTVTNEGTAVADNYSVDLYSGKQVVATKRGSSIAGGISTIVEFNLTMSPNATEDIVYSAKVVMTDDENAANDESLTVTVTPVASKLPTVNNLAGEIDGSAIKLTWDEPNQAAIPADAITEDFEDGLSFSSHYGDWTFVDKDGSPVEGFSNIEVPNIVPEVTKGSFWIWDTNTIGTGNKYFSAHSGSKYLFALYRADMGQSDEWAISPELNGTAQTITFYAKSYSGDYPEKIKVWYSISTTNPDDFIAVKTINHVASDWTRYEFDVPAGAKYFAINSCATNSFMLMVDDVTYIPADAPVSIHLQGYDIYCNNVKVNEEIINVCEYIDTDVEDGKEYEYKVVAIYNKGQSLPATISVRYQDSGIESAISDGINITPTHNSIMVTGAAGISITVNTADGKTLYSDRGDTQTIIPVQPGIYIVRAGQTVRKVLVK